MGRMILSTTDTSDSYALSQGNPVDEAAVTGIPCDGHVLPSQGLENSTPIATCLPLTLQDNQPVPKTNQEESRATNNLTSEDPKLQTELPRDVPATTRPIKIVVKLPPHLPEITASSHKPTKSAVTVSQNSGTSTLQHPKTGLKGHVVPVRLAKKNKGTNSDVALSSHHPQQLGEPQTHARQVVKAKKNVMKTDHKVSPARGRGPARYDPQSLLPPTLSYTLDSPTIKSGHRSTPSSQPASSQPATPPSVSRKSQKGKPKPPVQPSRSLSNVQRHLRPRRAMESRHPNALTQDWKEWQEVAIKIILPRDLHVSIQDIWATFKDQGQISTIEMGDNDRREAIAVVRFRYACFITSPIIY